MDEVLDVLGMFDELEMEGILAWLLRIVGVVAILAGLGLWLLTDMGLLVLPAALIVVGLVLLVVPELLGGLLELA